ncbi:MAG: ATP-binding protein [Magnetococcales bacterium]|nr:ATP-binding protein [Magnetococcales bacterium]
MTTESLKYYALSSLRGASRPFELVFEKGKKLTLIYGGNGTGKTTICDGFELLAHERIGSLDEKGLGAHLEQFWSTIGSEKTSISIELETGQIKLKASVRGKKVTITPPGYRPKVNVLRRNQILNIVEAQPAKRYDAIKRFIDIGSVEKAEAALHAHVGSFKARLEQTTTAISENEQALEGLRRGDPSSAGTTVIAWAKNKLEDSDLDVEQKLINIKNLISVINELEKSASEAARQKSNLLEAEIN